jgi:hypothetical protein
LRHWAIFKQYYTDIYKDNQILRIGPSVISTKVLFVCPSLMCNGAYLRDIQQLLCKKCRAQLESCWKPMVFILWICKVLCVKYVKTFIFFFCRIWITYRIKGVNLFIKCDFTIFARANFFFSFADNKKIKCFGLLSLENIWKPQTSVLNFRYFKYENVRIIETLGYL